MPSMETSPLFDRAARLLDCPSCISTPSPDHTLSAKYLVTSASRNPLWKDQKPVTNYILQRVRSKNTTPHTSHITHPPTYTHIHIHTHTHTHHTRYAHFPLTGQDEGYGRTRYVRPAKKSIGRIVMYLSTGIFAHLRGSGPAHARIFIYYPAGWPIRRREYREYYSL